jgi:hypothetical protein
MVDTGKASELFMRLRAADRMEIPQRAHALADAYGAEFTDQCIQPYELVTAAMFSELPLNRQDHVLGCSLCTLVVGSQDGIAPPLQPSRDQIAAAAAAARVPTPRWKVFAAIAAGASMLGAAFFTVVCRFVPRLRRGTPPLPLLPRE